MQSVGDQIAVIAGCLVRNLNIGTSSKGLRGPCCSHRGGCSGHLSQPPRVPASLCEFVWLCYELICTVAPLPKQGVGVWRGFVELQNGSTRNLHGRMCIASSGCVNSIGILTGEDV